jgi:N-acetylglucosamine kinase-like BadF-type ATPase
VTLVLGIDGGGTKTHALLADLSGEVVGVGRDGPSNWESVGMEGAAETLRSVMGQALAAAGSVPGDVRAATFGLGGIDWPSDVQRLAPAVESLGLPDSPELVNDAFVALRAGTRRSWGVAVVAGTGTVAAGRNASGQTFRTLGLGYEYGDFGDAGDVTRTALGAIAQAFTGMGEPTTLTDSFLESTGCRTVEEMLEAISRGLVPFPAGAPLVVRAASAGDPVAVGILERAGRSLGRAAGAVARRLDLADQEFDLVLSGGLFRGRSHLLHDALRTEVTPAAPRATLVLLELPPAVGAVVMAMERAGAEITGDMRERLADDAVRELAPTQKP